MKAHVEWLSTAERDRVVDEALGLIAATASVETSANGSG
jgi:hypothetical protein